jgi:hypothetical protein
MDRGQFIKPLRPLAVIALACVCLLPPAGAQETTPEDWGRTRSNALATALWRIAADAHVPIGFQSAERTRMLDRLKPAPQSDTRPLAERLDGALASDDRYEWRSMADMVVVRPKSAWTDPADPLNRPVRSLDANRLTVSAALEGLYKLVKTHRFAVHQTGVGDVSLHVDSGTVLDVLNKLVSSGD